jgi:large subunit ribosomal protein L25
MSTKLKTEPRARLGTRAARALRAAGRIPAVLPATPDRPHLDLSIGEDEFLASRRHHQHLFELEIEGQVETAIVNQLDWDVFGERITHVEFRRVDVRQRTEVRVPIEFQGHPKGGILVHLVTEITVSTTPDRIPDQVSVSVADLEPGAVVLASALGLPEGVDLGGGFEPGTPVARIAAPKVEFEPAPAEAEAAAAATPAVEGAAPAAAPAPEKPARG